MKLAKAKELVQLAVEASKDIAHPNAAQMLLQALLVKEHPGKLDALKGIGDWKARDEEIQLASRLGISWKIEADKMRSWALGAAKRKANWDATFRNWLRRTALRNGVQETEVNKIDEEEAKASRERVARGQAALEAVARARRESLARGAQLPAPGCPETRDQTSAPGAQADATEAPRAVHGLSLITGGNVG